MKKSKRKATKPAPRRAPKSKPAAQPRRAAIPGPLAAAAPVTTPLPSAMVLWDDECMDTAVLSACAADDSERKKVLLHAVANLWLDDIGMIRRVESQGRCMWVMWRRSNAPPA